MTLHGAAGYSLDFLAEPAFLLRRRGEVLNANAAARRLLGDDVTGGNLFDHVASSHEEFEDYLRRSTGSTAPLVGSVTLNTKEGAARFRVHCAVLPDRSAGSILVLRCQPASEDRFSILGRRVRELNIQLVARVREKAVLEEALRQNENLTRELQHRVKNNIQIMASLIQITARESQSAEVKEVVEKIRLRLQAMASVQDAIYRSHQYGTVAAGALLTELVTSIGHSFGAVSNLRIQVTEAEISSDAAHALALIANELVTNAIKHGLPDRRGTIRVTFGPQAGGYELVVHDSGGGIALESASRSSGLGLVRGLCRQIGGALEITNENGARCSVRFDAKDDGGKT